MMNKKNDLYQLVNTIKDENAHIKYMTAITWIKNSQKGISPVDKLRDKGIERIVIYGMTELGELFVNEAIAKELEVLGICDNRIRYGTEEYLGIELFSRERLRDYKNEVVVVCAVTFFEQIFEQLNAEGFINVICLYDLM